MGRKNKRAASEATDGDEVPDAKHFKTAYTDVVTVLVGDKEEFFTVHVNLLRDSGFFKAACSGTWTEARQKKVLLPDQAPELFQTYLDWLYGQKKPSVSSFVKKELLDYGFAGIRKKLESAEVLCGLWLLWDYLQDEHFTNLVMDELVQDQRTRSRLIPLDTIIILLKTTRADPGLHKWLVQHLAVFVIPPQVLALRQQLSADVLFPLLIRFTAWKSG